MNSPALPEPAAVGRFLEGPTPLAEKAAACDAILSGMSGWTTEDIGKAACWSAYRRLEGWFLSGKNELKKLIEQCEAALGRIAGERDQFIHHRWHVSVLTAQSYLNIRLTGGGVRVPVLKSIRHCPFAFVNVARMLVLHSAALLSAGDKAKAARRLAEAHALFPVFAALLPVDEAAFCAGGETVSAAKAMAIAYALHPHVGIPFVGEIMPLEHIALIEQAEPFCQSLRRLLRLPPARQGVESGA